MPADDIDFDDEDEGDNDLIAGVECEWLDLFGFWGSF